MKKIYSKKQILEAINHWKKALRLLNESEDGLDNIQGLTSYFARDLIYDDAPHDVHKCEITYRFFNATRLLFNILPEDIKLCNKIYQENPEYRIMSYYVFYQYDPEWKDADDNIKNELDFEEYINKKSYIWKNDQEYFDEFVQPFIKKFPSYQDWINYKGNKAKKNLLDIFQSSGKSPYEDIKENEIKITSDGTAYVLIIWRA